MSATTQYERIITVERKLDDGNVVTLALQRRWSGLENSTWPTLSWRTRLRPGGPNRRFYMLDGQAWMIDASLALDIIEEMERRGGLADVHRDRRPKDLVAETYRSSEPGNRPVLDDVTLQHEDWGEDPLWVVLEERTLDSRDLYAEPFRKAMIVDRASGLATFRGTTTNTRYSPRRELRPGAAWFLDNAMPDLSVQQVEIMLGVLRTAR